MHTHIVIAGDATRRGELLAAVQRAGFVVHVCHAAQAEATLRKLSSSAALIVCIEDADRETNAFAVQAGRDQIGVPVLLHAAVGGDAVKMADLIALDADGFLEAPVDAHTVRQVLREVIGGAEAAVQRRSHPETDESPTARQRIHPLSAPSWQAPANSPQGRSGDDTDTIPSPGQWHRTLDRLEARLHGEDEHAPTTVDDSHDDIDLASLGVDSIPPVEFGGDDDEAASSGVRLRLSTLVVADGVGLEMTVSSPAANEAQAVDATERLGKRPRPAGTDTGASSRSVFAQHVVAGDRQTVTEAGAIGRTDVPHLLWQLYLDGYTGLVTFTRKGTRKRVWLHEGQLRAVHGESRGDSFIDGLAQRGWLTNPHARHARSLRIKGLEKLAGALVEHGYLKRSELDTVLGDHLARVLDATFAWEEGEWVLGHGERSDDELDVFLPIPRVLINGCRWRLPPALARRRLGGGAAFPALVQRIDPLRVRQALHIDELGLDDHERQWLNWLDGRRSLDELAALDEPLRPRVLGLVYALELMGFVHLGRATTVAGNEEAADLDMFRIRERLTLARRGDFFALLGVSRDPTDGDVARAHASLCERFSDEHLELSVVSSLQAELTELRGVLDTALATLGDEASRRKYLAMMGGRPEPA